MKTLTTYSVNPAVDNRQVKLYGTIYFRSSSSGVTFILQTLWVPPTPINHPRLEGRSAINQSQNRQILYWLLLVSLTFKLTVWTWPELFLRRSTNRKESMKRRIHKADTRRCFFIRLWSFTKYSFPSSVLGNLPIAQPTKIRANYSNNLSPVDLDATPF